MGNTAYIVQDDDTLIATGTVRGDSVGSLVKMQGENTLIGTGRVDVVGSASLTPGDYLVAYGTVRGWTTSTPTRSSWTQINA